MRTRHLPSQAILAISTLIFAFVCVFVSVFPASAAGAATSGTCGENLTWTLDSSGTLTIQGTGPMENYNHLDPKFLDSHFAPWYDVRDRIQKVVIGNGVTTVGDLAFSECSRLSEVSLPEGIVRLGTSAFGETAIREFRCPSTVTELGQRAFGECKELESVTLSDRITEIPANTFWDCYSLRSLTVPASVKSIAPSAFGNCYFDPLIFEGTAPEFPPSSLGDSVVGSGTVNIFVPYSSYRSYLPLVDIYKPLLNSGSGVTYRINTDQSSPLSLNDNYFTLSKGESFQMEVDGSLGSGLEVQWYSQKPDVARVDSSGRVTAVSRGIAPLYAVADNGRQAAILGAMVQVEENMNLLTQMPTAGITAEPPVLAFIHYEGTDGETMGYSPAKYIEDDPSDPTYQEILGITRDVTAGCTTNLEKTEAIADWVSSYLTYDLVLPGEGIDSIYAVYHRRVANCMGYSLLTGLMLYMADVPNATVNNISHMWNLALVEDGWVQLDSIPGTVGLKDTQYGSIQTIYFTQGGLNLVVDDLSGVKLAGIGPHIFQRGGIPEVTIPDYVTGIMAYAFEGASDLTSITIPVSVTYLHARSLGPVDRFDLKNLTDIWYLGTEQQWRQIRGSQEAAMNCRANIHFASSTPVFPGLSPSDYYYDAVNWASTRRIIGEAGDPPVTKDSICTRGQMVTFLWRASGSPEPSATTCPFTDVRPTDYCYKAVLWALEREITEGTSATTFSPNEACNRAHMVTFFWRLNYKVTPRGSSPFKDVNRSDRSAYYAQAAIWAYEKGLVKGTGGGLFSPNDPCLCVQILTVLHRQVLQM